MQIMYDVLSLLEGRNEGIKPTRIMYGANLSHDMLKQYLGESLAFGFARNQDNRWFLVEKGHTFLRKMRDIAELFVMEKEAGAIAIIR